MYQQFFYRKNGKSRQKVRRINAQFQFIRTLLTFNTYMQSTEHQFSLFIPLSKHPSLAQQLINDPSQVKCSFFQDSQDMNQHHRLVSLQIKSKWLLQLSQNGQIISFLELNWTHSFQIQSIPNPDSQKQNQISMIPISILFKIVMPQSKNVKLRIIPEDRQHLQIFRTVLQKKCIMQEGNSTIFKPIKRIGRGQSATVYSVQNMLSKKTQAIKSIKKQNEQKVSSIIKEINIWRKLDHPHICSLHSVYQSETSISLATQLFQLSLSALIKAKGFPPRDLTVRFLKQILEAVVYMHSKGIIHRDIKPENIMIRNNKNLKQAVLIDFGLAYELGSQIQEDSRCGTPGYTAPQILSLPQGYKKVTYGSKCDVFSIGVVAYMLFFHKFPFETKQKNEIINLNLQCKVQYPAVSEQVSQDLIFLISRMLEKSQTERVTAQGALQLLCQLADNTGSQKEIVSTKQFIK